MPEVTTTTAAAFLGEEWTKFTLDAIQFAQVLQDTVRRLGTQEVATGNRILHIPHVSNLTANAKTQGTDVTYEAITQTNQDITISTWRYVAFEVNSITEVQSRYDLVEKYTQTAGYALSRGFETDLAALPDDLSTAIGSLGLELTEDDLNDAVTGLDNNGAPDDRFWWFSPNAVAAVRKIDKFVSADFTGNNARAVDTAMVGNLLGGKVVKSALLEANAALTQHDCCFFARPQFMLIEQLPAKVESDRIIDSLTDAVVAHAIHITAEAEIPAEAAGSEALDDEWGRFLRTV